MLAIPKHFGNATDVGRYHGSFTRHGFGDDQTKRLQFGSMGVNIAGTKVLCQPVCSLKGYVANERIAFSLFLRSLSNGQELNRLLRKPT